MEAEHIHFFLKIIFLKKLKYFGMCIYLSVLPYQSVSDTCQYIPSRRNCRMLIPLEFHIWISSTQQYSQGCQYRNPHTSRYHIHQFSFQHKAFPKTGKQIQLEYNRCLFYKNVINNILNAHLNLHVFFSVISSVFVFMNDLFLTEKPKFFFFRITSVIFTMNNLGILSRNNLGIYIFGITLYFSYMHSPERSAPWVFYWAETGSRCRQ